MSMHRLFRVAFALALPVTAARGQWITVYQNDFETAPGPELSSTSGPLGLFAHYVDCSGAYCTTYLGLASGRLFANDDITLSLSGLPLHTAIRGSVDLLLFGSWEGNDAPGPDLLSFGSPGVSTTTTSFATVPGTTQSFPNKYPTLHPANTGAVEVNTLGTHFGSPLSAVYHLSVTAPDTRTNPSGFVLGSGLEDWTNEAYTIDNLHVEVLVTPEPATALLILPASALLWLAARRRRGNG